MRSVDMIVMPPRWAGFRTLVVKELRRIAKVGFQTIAAPIISALLYLMIFSHVLEGKVTPFPGVAYTSFLVPGLIMMATLQNSFANSSSSFAQSKVTGNIVFVLLPPLSHMELYLGYALAAIARGLTVGLGVFLATTLFVSPQFHAIGWVLTFAVLCSAFMGTMGLIAGIWAERFDQIAAFQNFLIMPMTFLSGVFYSVHSLPGVWQSLSHLNPFFYMVDGFRYGFFGQSDISPWISLLIVALALVLSAAVCIRMLATGYKLRH